MYSKRFEKETFKEAVRENVRTLYRKNIAEASPQQIFQAVSYAVKDIIMDDWIATQKAYDEADAKTVYYMSMEFLMGRALGNNLINMTAYKEVKEALEEMDIDLNVVEDEEPDAALGNGGLGRLAAWFLDSLSTLNYPAYGCGIRYRYGMFKQKIENGYQVETPDNWLKEGNPFELRREEYAKEVRFGGNVHFDKDPETGKDIFVQENYESVLAIPYDMPIVGYGNHVVNTLRVWDAKAITDFQLDAFDRGDYHKSVEQENLAKLIVDVLYPNDNHYAGKELRLKQQYFFISASLQTMLEKYKKKHSDVRKLYEKVAIQMNDTHPTVAVPELMRLLIDQEGLTWEEAWDVTTKTCAYTNHTIMSEALEKWPLDYLNEVVPQLVPIIEKLDAKAKEKYKDESVAIIDSQDRVHMAHMDIHYGFSVNGVAALHTDILKNSELKAFYQIYPEKFNNKTNGITFRRWLMHCNLELSEYISSLIGDSWKKDSSKLEKLLEYQNDTKVLNHFLKIKQKNKQKLCMHLKEKQDLDIDPNSIFDIQIKRLHEYKRQQLNALYAIYKYKQIKSGQLPQRPITMIFGAKAAPAYTLAKDIIHLILCLQKLTLSDPEVSPYLKVIMVENYNVTEASHLIPACDISEQISLASKEASGTGNMKFMLNGAVTLGTMDGANVEICNLVGKDNIYIFGKSSQEVIQLYETSGYHSDQYYDNDPLIQNLVDFIISKEMIRIGDPENLCRLYKDLISKDWFMTLLDLKEYIAVKENVMADYEDRMNWAGKMLINTAKAGYFSSDRTIAEYNRDIWKL